MLGSVVWVSGLRGWWWMNSNVIRFDEIQMKKSILILAAVALGLLVTGCSTTPTSRIERNQALFNTFSPEVQTKVRDGEVDVGFTPEQVRVAWGNPSRRLEEKDINGSQEVWVYARNESKYAHVRDPFFYGGYNRRYRRGGVYNGGLYGGDLVRVKQTVEVGRVTFQDGVVSNVQVAK